MNHTTLNNGFPTLDRRSFMKMSGGCAAQFYFTVIDADQFETHQRRCSGQRYQRLQGHSMRVLDGWHRFP